MYFITDIIFLVQFCKRSAKFYMPNDIEMIKILTQGRWLLKTGLIDMKCTVKGKKKLGLHNIR